MNAVRIADAGETTGPGPRGAAGAEPVVAESAAMREILDAVDDVAAGNTTVLILGESGTGKEVVARRIHRRSPRAAGPWVAVNCAAMPADLLESELFGHERGAFTGATERRAGRVEQADKGTLLLDEISELPPALQAKLLRVLQEREVNRLGGNHPVPVDLRVIATSNRDLGQMVERKEFRADLYYRLFVFPIVLPPLRERPDDIPALAHHLLQRLAGTLGRPAPTLTEGALAGLRGYRFPGNVRELGNVLERAMVRCRFPVLDRQHLDLGPGDARQPEPRLGRSERAPLPERRFLPAGVPVDLASLERMAIAEALRRVSGNRTHASRLLGISLRTLRNKLRGYRLARAASADGQILPGAAGVEGDGEERAPGDADRFPVELEADSTSARSSHSDSNQKEHAA